MCRYRLFLNALIKERINVTAKKSDIKGSQEGNSPFTNFAPNKNIANKMVKLKQSVNHKNSIEIRRDTLCILLHLLLLN
jgi:hypothetical protein